MKPEKWIEDNVEIAVSDGFGIYAPQTFCQRFDRETAKPEDWETVLSGPDEEWYWEAWAAIEQDWEDAEGRTIFQSGDIFLIGPDAPEEIWDMLGN